MKKSVFVKKTEEFSKKLQNDFVKKLVVFDELDSTNSTAKELVQSGAEEGTIVIARTQTHGRGRFDRTWQSPEGGVYLSIILRPAVPIEKTSLLPFVAALAVSTTLESYGVHTTIKWPNDVRVSGKKIAGILLESEVKGQTVNYVVIGIGINLNIDLAMLSPDLQTRSTSLLCERGTPVDAYEFLKKFFFQCDFYYKLFKEERYDSLINHWKNKADTIGRIIQVQTSIEIIQGTAIDIDTSGFLLLKTKTGEIKKIMSGDCLYFDELHHT
jgi:BirA family transcriptional regulator, biotin operon repressor / biotin---[acetyl-CoA-carboxylase] ligase